MEFEYSVNEMKSFLIINLKGRITKDSKERLNACMETSLEYKEKNVLIILKDVVGIDHIMSRDFALFQQNIRAQSKSFFLIGLKLQLKQELQGRGIVRIHEVKNTIGDVGLKTA